MSTQGDRLTADLLRPLQRTGILWYGLVAFLGTVVVCGLFAWAAQMWYGFGLTGIRWPVYWGFLITDFVFWIGISHAGTLISAILRLVNAGWRRPVTRCAEVITAFALMIGGLFPIIHLGKPWLFFWLVPYPNRRLIWPNFRSPLVWDFFAISGYLTGSLLFLFLPMIPDFAIIRDQSTGMKKKIYGVLALGWRGTTHQWHRLETAMQIMAIAIIPVAVSVHTIVSFDFSMAPVPMWHSTIFGPYFVAGAIFSGIAGLIIAMVLRPHELRLLIPDFGIIRSLVTKGLPMGFQMIVTSLAAVTMMSLVNKHGVHTSAAYGAAAKGSTMLNFVGIDRDRADLDRRIAERYDRQLEAGFLDEIRRLAGSPPGLSPTAAQALGYKELLEHVNGACSLDEALELARRRTRRFARRQQRWFRRDPRIRWIDGAALDADPTGVARGVLKDWTES